MNVDMITGDIIKEGYEKPKTPQGAKNEAVLKSQVQSGIAMEQEVNSPEGRRIIAKFVDDIANKTEELISGRSEMRDEHLLTLIRGLYYSLSSLGHDVKIGRLAAEKLARKEFPFLG